jgi:Predicted heme/steroid binding protein
MKKYLFFLILLNVVGLSACATDPLVTEAPTTQAIIPDRTFTTEQLAQYNGRDGQPTYVAIDGLVYDLSTSSRWVNGNHNGNQAGQDLSRQIPQNHRADMRFERFPVVGRYVGS